MISICQLFHLNYHLFFLLFCFDILFYFDFHNNNNDHFHFHFLHFYLLDFLILMFYQFKIIFDKSSNKFNNSFCPEISFLCFISEFFIMFNVFTRFLAPISLIVLSLILLPKSLMSIYLNSLILFL